MFGYSIIGYQPIATVEGIVIDPGPPPDPETEVILAMESGTALLLKTVVRTLGSPGTATLYPAATLSRSSVNADTPSDTWVPGVFQPSLNFNNSLFSTADPRNNSTEATGIISLNDSKDDLDYLFNYSWDNADITIFRGNKSALFNTWSEIAKYNGIAIIGDFDKKIIKIRDLSWRLNCLIHNEFYQGTGGLEGGEDLKGIWKPVMYGSCYNVQPKLIDSANSIYQFNVRQSQSVIAVRHGGVPLAFHTNYANLADLIAGTIPTGYYGTCLAQGLIRPSIDVEKSIKVDAIGDSRTISGYTTPMNRSEIARRVITTDGDTNLDDATELSADDFNFVDTYQPADLGFFWDSEITKMDALTEIMSGILGWWYVKPEGVISIGYTRDPSSISALNTIQFKEYGMSKIEMIDFLHPRAKTQIGWRKNYSPEPRDRLAPSVDLALANILEQDSSYATEDTASTIQQYYPLAETVKIQGNFANESDAITEAQRQHDLMSLPRRRFRFQLEIDPFSNILGQTFSLENVNRLTLGSAKNLICVRSETVGFGPVLTEWWG